MIGRKPFQDPVWDRAHREMHQAEKEKEQLSKTAWDLSSTRKMAGYSVDQLRKAALLQHHAGELGFVGKEAVRELERRGIRS